MRELSLNMLDIAQNSLSAGATLVALRVAEDHEGDTLTLRVEDNGCGMTAEQVQQVTDPFYTTRTTRPVGMGIPLFRMVAEMSGGDLLVESAPGVGTTVTATFRLSHIDRLPLGDMTSTVLTLIRLHPATDFLYQYTVDAQSFTLDTRELRETLGEVPLNEPDVLAWIDAYIQEQTAALGGSA